MNLRESFHKIKNKSIIILIGGTHDNAQILQKILELHRDTDIIQLGDLGIKEETHKWFIENSLF